MRSKIGTPKEYHTSPKEGTYMRVDNIPNPVLNDMLATLKGDAPILVGKWSLKSAEIREGDVTFFQDMAARYLESGNKVYEEPTACGCLMMDNHVEEYFNTRNDTYFVNDETSFLADLYTRKLHQSKYYRGVNLNTSDIEIYAEQFDRWASTRRVQAYIHGTGSNTILNDDGRQELIQIIKKELADRRKDPSLHEWVSAWINRHDAARRTEAAV